MLRTATAGMIQGRHSNTPAILLATSTAWDFTVCFTFPGDDGPAGGLVTAGAAAGGGTTWPGAPSPPLPCSTTETYNK